MTSRSLLFLAVLLALPLALASADIGLVFDLDGNYQNGPDTLQIEPEDTVLVHVWITGAGDSLGSIGITLGDTTGALVWVEEEASSLYTTPTGWMNIPGHLDFSGRVLIQAGDFGHSTPLILPSQVAEVKFTVAPGESCGTIGWDPEVSGWQDWAFTEGGFAAGETPVLCVSEVQDAPQDSGGTESPSEGAVGRLVWQVRIQEDTAVLVRNEFPTDGSKTSGRSFPVPSLRVVRVRDQTQRRGDGLETSISREIAPLLVNSDGTLDSPSLEFVPPARVSSAKAFSLLGLADDSRSWKVSPQIPVSYVNLTNRPGQAILGWEESADRQRGVVHTEQATFFIDATVSEPPGPRPLVNFYVYPTFGVVLADEAECVAMVARADTSRKVLVSRFDGSILFEEPEFTDFHYDQLYLTPQGDALIVDREHQGRPTEIFGADLATGATKILEDVEEGDRYYSRDGSRLLVVQSGFGRAYYYDVSDPLDPQALWSRPFEAEVPIITAAVSDNGSYVALQTYQNGGRGEARTVIVLDQEGTRIAGPLQESRGEGLQFESGILFVGVQRHPIPVGVHWESTTEILAFDFRK